MKGLRHRRTWLNIGLAAAFLLVISGVALLTHTFSDYNELSLQRQDAQLQDMAQAADENIAVQLASFRKDLNYVLGRRGYVQAELQWSQTGDTADLLFRMQENLVAQNALVRAVLAISAGEIFLSTDGSVDYLFPAGTEAGLQPCFAGDAACIWR